MPERWLSVDEISSNLGVNLDTIYEWITRSRLPAPKPKCLLPFLPLDAGWNPSHFAFKDPARRGIAGFVLANGIMSSNRSVEGDPRRAQIEAELVDGMVALPAQIFYSTQKFSLN
jgi:hypothetical protein